MKGLICRLFHFKHWEVYNTWYGEVSYRWVICDKCNQGHKIRLGKEVE